MCANRIIGSAGCASYHHDVEMSPLECICGVCGTETCVVCGLLTEILREVQVVEGWKIELIAVVARV